MAEMSLSTTNVSCCRTTSPAISDFFVENEGNLNFWQSCVLCVWSTWWFQSNERASMRCYYRARIGPADENLLGAHYAWILWPPTDLHLESNPLHSDTLKVSRLQLNSLFWSVWCIRFGLGFFSAPLYFPVQEFISQHLSWCPPVSFFLLRRTKRMYFLGQCGVHGCFGEDEVPIKVLQPEMFPYSLQKNEKVLN